MAKLNIDRSRVAHCRALAGRVAAPIAAEIARRSTTSIERSILRLWGVAGAVRGVPLANLVVDRLAGAGRLAGGVALPFAALASKTRKRPGDLAKEIAAGRLNWDDADGVSDSARRQAAGRLTAKALSDIRQARGRREGLQRKLGEAKGRPLFYVIVATGNIHEDVKQARSAYLAGADCIAVIRSTAQSLLDYVPEGLTTEGFGGTYATQANFRLMRQALDEVARRHGRYVRLVNYASGLCMPEISALAALERLDMLLNDSMYGIIFRDINPMRTLTDQHFSRQIIAAAAIVINTGEDNYLTTADAVEAAHTVLASQFINERFARLAGLPPRLMGLGHAFDVDPAREDSLLYEIAMAQLVREVFPDCPIKYMPPTRHMTGDIFFGCLHDGLFDLVSVMTGQSIHLLGMMSEAVHNPFLHDRLLAIQAADYVARAARNLGAELRFAGGGFIQRRCAQVLREAEMLLERIARTGLLDALAEGVFADIRRPSGGGKGAEGCFLRGPDYLNPFEGRLNP